MRVILTYYDLDLVDLGRAFQLRSAPFRHGENAIGVRLLDEAAFDALSAIVGAPDPIIGFELIDMSP